MKKLLVYVFSAVAGIWAAALWIPGVRVALSPSSHFFGIALSERWQILLIVGFAIGLLNLFAKPVLDIVALPLRILTLGFFSFVINMALVWVVSMIIQEFMAPLFWPLFWTTFLIWAIQHILSKILLKEEF